MASRISTTYARFARRLMGGVLVLSDLAALFVSALVVLVFWSSVNEKLDLENYVTLLPVLLVFVIVYMVTGLYPAIGLSPVDELRRLTLATTGVFMGLGTLSFYIRNMSQWSRASFALSWLLALLLIPVFRKLVRSLACRQGWWGEPVAIIGFGEQGQRLYDRLISRPQFGLRPTLALEGSLDEHGAPRVVSLDRKGKLEPASLLDLQTAILITDEISTELLSKLIDDRWGRFSHLVLIPGDHKMGSVWITPYDIGGTLGLEVHQNLLSRWQQFSKRLLDIFLVIISIPVLIPVFVLLALAIRIDSPGKVFFTQKRVGRGNNLLKVVKFRTMQENAEEALEIYLNEHPELREEWEANYKLKHDPRVTRMGRFLRRTSLDELPQVWNVLCGEMSLVGPRPIVQEEIPMYGHYFNLYTQVLPGMTGMWQVSGRNDLSYEERVRLDEYYVRNWSIWLDFYILASTVFAILTARGAY